jgi:CPA1 family monovalent cation:H+ antiporter
VSDVISALLALALLLTIVSLLVPLAERLRLPHTVLLAVAGLGLGLVSSELVAGGGVLEVLHDAFHGMERLEGGTNFFLPLFLPPLLFTAGLTIDVRRLLDEISAVLLLAIVAVLVCIAGVAGVVHFATGYDIVACLLVGVIVSPTDPAAVIGIFRDVGAPKRLSILAEGESLFNDAVAIAAFGFVMDILILRTSPELGGQGGGQGGGSATGLVGDVAWDLGGGIALGFLLTRATMFVLPRLGDSGVAIASVTVSLAYLSYVLADHYLHVSGVVAVVVAALTLAAYGPTHLHPPQWTSLRQLWRQLDFWSNCLIVVLASMVAENFLPHLSWLYLWGVLAVVVGASLARVLVVFGLLPLLEAVRLVQPVDTRYRAILVWGGLRGAVTIVLAMVVAGDSRLPETVREFIAELATLFVFFTLFVNATTLGVLMRLLGLDKLSRLEIALRDRVLALSRVNVQRQLRQIMREHNEQVLGLDVDPASAGDAETEAPPADLALELHERIAVGLLTLSTQEKELYLELFEQQTLSRRMVALSTARADRLIDAVRGRGMAGYEEVVHGFAEPDLVFRLALWLHRRFSLDWLLTERLADRFELLMVSQGVLAELSAFNNRSIADLLGGDAEKRLAAVIQDRRDLVSRALQDLTLQYPGYAESIKDRQIERASIRFESAEYARRLNEGIISREVYTDLLRELNTRRSSVSRRPTLNLGLELAGMIGRVPLFAGLDPEAVREVVRRLRPLVAMPGEKIIAVGGPPDAMFFITAGEVTVHIAGGTVTLKEGSFFGEMGLLDSKPRTADVVASGYCHFLVLYRRDFNALLRDRPGLREEIERVAAVRVASMPAAS